MVREKVVTSAYKNSISVYKGQKQHTLFNFKILQEYNAKHEKKQKICLIKSVNDVMKLHSLKYELM